MPRPRRCGQFLRAGNISNRPFSPANGRSGNDTIAAILQAAIAECMNTLTLRYNANEGQDGELIADVAIGQFKGSGSAWFSLKQLREFCRLVGIYPITKGEEPVLAGGFWDKSGDELKECHLGIWISPHNVRGSLKVSITVAEPASDEEAVNDRRLTANFLVNYSDVERFRGEFLALLEGQSEQAILRAAPN